MPILYQISFSPACRFYACHYRDVRVSPNDNVIVERDADYFASFYEPLRLCDIFFRRCGVSARMVVRNYHGHCPKPDCLTEDVAWMKECLIHSASRYNQRLAEKVPLCVKVEGVGTFLRFVYPNRLYLPHDIVRSLNRARERAVRSSDIAFHERECGGELNSSNLAYARNLRRDDLLPRRIDKIRRAPEVPD